MAQTIKHLPTMQETWVQSLGLEDPLEKEMATHFSTLAWKIPWREGLGIKSIYGLFPFLLSSRNIIWHSKLGESLYKKPLNLGRK